MASRFAFSSAFLASAASCFILQVLTDCCDIKRLVCNKHSTFKGSCFAKPVGTAGTLNLSVQSISACADNCLPWILYLPVQNADQKWEIWKENAPDWKVSKGPFNAKAMMWRLPKKADVCSQTYVWVHCEWHMCVQPREAFSNRNKPKAFLS